MKLQPLDQGNIKPQLRILNIIIPVFAGIIIFFSSCEQNTIEKINTITANLNVPSQSLINSEIIYSESAKIVVVIKSPEINRYLTIENPYSEFPKGIFVQFFDSTQTPTSYIKSNYANFDEKTKIWIAEHDVEAVNSEGDTLNTEYLIWNQTTKRITSDRYVRITNEEGIIQGKGFEANQDMTNWKIKQTTGTILVSDEK
ncbi:MAG: LPS export ABC transporter periplasmic protein LptC [Bacteroidetes bacterium GWF2_33_16]|nr:MAG: LPS export ABC transporter periplasmic protein LptC [Bacteroidetes bacterium GWE2_32_14]OFY08578.1 MAG: LPS export ABC transporter periplasmic protein LptC [Bacteroidetes bacterium GWF2_33_16]